MTRKELRRKQLKIASVAVVAATTAAFGAADFGATVKSILESAKPIFQFGGIAAALYGGYKIIVEGQGGKLEWFLFIVGAGVAGATQTVIDFVAALFTA